jgi:predicted RNA-binding protein with PIN domain
LRQSLEDVFIAARDVAASAGIEAATPDSVKSVRPPAPSGSAVADSPQSRIPPRKRLPAPLPPAVFDESPEAARHLVRLPGSVLVVDGYNVTISSWPGADLPMQRRRLIDSLFELVMRAGTEVVVIFDGVDEGNRLQLPSSVRGRMRVRFTSSEIEADQVIIDSVDSLPVERPIVVATDDRRVRETVAQRGANVISVDQLLAVIGRAPNGTG